MLYLGIDAVDQNRKTVAEETQPVLSVYLPMDGEAAKPAANLTPEQLPEKLQHENDFLSRKGRNGGSSLRADPGGPQNEFFHCDSRLERGLPETRAALPLPPCQVTRPPASPIPIPVSLPILYGA